MRNFVVELESPCSFCGVPHPQHVILTCAKATAHVCGACIGLCAEILGEETAVIVPPPMAADFREALDRISAHIARNELVLRPPERPDGRCSFCQREAAKVARLISGPRVFICERCVIAAAYTMEGVKLREQYGPRYDELLRLLARKAPVRIDSPYDDEYAPEARALAHRLDTCKSAEDVGALLHSVLVELFNERIAGPKAAYDELAPEIWRIWHGEPC